MLLDAQTARILTKEQHKSNTAQLQKVDALIREAVIQGIYKVRVYLPLTGSVQSFLETKGYTLTAIPEMGSVTSHIEVSWAERSTDLAELPNDRM